MAMILLRMETEKNIAIRYTVSYTFPMQTDQPIQSSFSDSTSGDETLKP